MGFLFIYEPSEYGRIIPAVNIDARSSITAIKNQVGIVIKAYTDAEVAKITDNVLFFKIETIANKGQTADGVLAGYFSLTISNDGFTAVLNQFVLRPAFQKFSTQISAQIINFIGGNFWQEFYL